MQLGKRNVLFDVVGVAIALVVVAEEFPFINCQSGKYHH